MARRISVLFLAVLPLGLAIGACGVLAPPAPTALSDLVSTLTPTASDKLLVRIAQVTDTHIVDEESPGRLAQFDAIVSSAWRPQEAYSAQILDGLIRGINRYHQQVGQIDALIHTGDATDNAQQNELGWFLAVMDGEMVNPRSGPDDRDPNSIPPPLLDPHHPFQAEGVYTQSQHGPLPTIPWFGVPGNHDVFASGNFPIVEQQDGRRFSPMPLDWRPGFWLPVFLIPDGEWSYDPITPANPGPPSLFGVPVYVEPNPARAFLSRTDLLKAYLASTSEPAGHGFEAGDPPQLRYTRLLSEGVRLIALDTTDIASPLAGLPYPEGAISQEQIDWFRQQLDQAKDAGEWVIVATHHPSDSLQVSWGSAISPDAFRAILNSYDNVILHLAGHTHSFRVVDRGGYLEMVTGSTLDYPQLGRIVTIYRRETTGEILIAYETVSSLESQDELLQMRQIAYDLAAQDAGRAADKATAQTSKTRTDAATAREFLAGNTSDHQGCIALKKDLAAPNAERGTSNP